MKKPQFKSQQSGFTLIELVVVIVILGILAATALPRFANMSTEARMAKMSAAAAALKTGASLFHAQWLVNGSPQDSTNVSTAAGSVVQLEGTPIAFTNGYPDVGGDGFANAAQTTSTSGIVVAAGGLADYTVANSGASVTQLVITPDGNHANCSVVYTEATTVGGAPVVDMTGISTSNCQ